MSRRLIESCARIAETTNSLQDLAKTKERQDIEQLKNVNADLVNQVYWQVAGHFLTAGLCTGLGAGAHFSKIGDAASAVTIGSKGGETLSTWLRAGETRLQGEQRIIEHKLNKGPEKRFDEFFQQFIRYVQDYQQQIGRARGVA